eukprot:g13404.t1
MAMDTPTTDRLMRLAVSGSTGLVGSALCDRLSDQGRDVRPIVRRPSGIDGEVLWETTRHTFDADALAPCDAVVHLAGETIMGRWTDEKMQRIRDSRIKSTRALAQTLAGIKDGPRTLVVASAIGYYGDTGQSDAKTEDDPPGDVETDFLAEVCVEWERAAEPARQAGIRVVHVRIGIVLSPDGGALAEMLLPFKLGLGGRLGSGRQWMSWIALPDLVRIIEYAVDTPGIAGPINATAPDPVTNLQFTKALGRALKRPTLLPVPGFAPKLLYGKDCAEATALRSVRAIPKRLIDAGFVFQFTDLDAALRHALDRA